MGAIAVRNVWVEYGEQVVLERVNLEITTGAFITVVGPSGAGKSTFLRLILGQERPTRGAILLDDLGSATRVREADDRLGQCSRLEADQRERILA